MVQYIIFSVHIAKFDKVYQIYHNINIQTDSLNAFRYCSEPNHINNWWTKRCSFAPEFDWRATVTELIKGHKIAFTFTQADSDWTDTILSFEIEEDGDGVLLHLRHKNWTEDNEHFGRTSYCWAMYMSTLKMYIETGKVLSYEDRGGN